MAKVESVKVGCGCLPSGAPALLGVAFIFLKLWGKIDWSWWWVTCPFWAGYAILAGFFMLFGGGFVALLGVLGLADYFSRRR
jgi:hypothetical protein